MRHYMTPRPAIPLFLLTALLVSLTPARANTGRPLQDTEWIDPETGHRVILWSRLPGRSNTLYFHQHAFTEKGDLFVFYNINQDGQRRLHSLNLFTREITRLNDRDTSWYFFPQVAPKSRQVIVLSGNQVLAIDLDTRKSRRIATIPQEWTSGRGWALNSDETLLAACAVIGERELTRTLPREGRLRKIMEAGLHNILYTIDLKTGEIRTLLETRKHWLGHVQFSPVDPALLMYCHEGPWRIVEDRMWTLRTDTANPAPKPVNPTLLRGIEANGHEFFDTDGGGVWFDQWIYDDARPDAKTDALGGRDFYLARVNLSDGAMTHRYPIPKDAWSYHYAISADRTFFAGDGNHSGPGSWIYRYTPATNTQARPTLNIDKLASLAGNKYPLEPNVRFTPDGKWVVFQSNASGDSQVYAVELAKPSPPPPPHFTHAHTTPHDHSP
ncbi:hypothetical protein Ga0100231_010335 [Opitutaceae bacterium TAV4]|nr:hypothetical protein Ga0100231_010335 [Opitutaceae bacterium TAV4]